MKTIICAIMLAYPITWPSVSGQAEAEPWVEPIGAWYRSFKKWKGYKA